MQPSIRLKSSNEILNTHRAKTIKELYDLLLEPSGYFFEYRVGEKSNTWAHFRIRNNTVNVALKITISSPKFITVDSSVFVLAASETKDIVMTLNETEFLNGTFKKGPLQDNLKVTIIPESSTIIPLILNDLSPLTSLL
jgi:hypothetical protein